MNAHSAIRPVVSERLPLIGSPTRILLVDDHGIVRDALALLLGGNADMEIVGSAATGEEAVRAAQSLRPAIVIMDLVLPDLNGIDATRRILDELPETRVIALSACGKAEHVRRALRSGVCGYVLKAALGPELLLAVRTVAAGAQYLSPSIAAFFAAPENYYEDEGPLDRLSTRERDVLRDVVAGSTSVDIARRLCLSRKTVDTYRSRIMAKLGVSNRSALIRIAMEYDLPTV
jgi:DNA-binding NarL/FixJ family response regulator